MVKSVSEYGINETSIEYVDENSLNEYINIILVKLNKMNIVEKLLVRWDSIDYNLDNRYFICRERMVKFLIGIIYLIGQCKWNTVCSTI